MMLKTSSNKVNPATSMLGFTIRKNIGIIVLVTIGFLLFCPCYTIIDLTEFEAEKSEIAALLSAWSKAFSLFCSIICGLMVIALNLLNFSFMYRRNASDFTDSLPITRVELYLSKTLAGYVLSLIPAFISLLSLGVLTVVYGTPKLLTGIFLNMCYIALTTAFSSALSMIFIVASASIFDFLISYVAVNGGLLVAGIIISDMLYNLLLGYSNNSMNEIFKVVSPIYYVFVTFGLHLFDNSADWITVGYIAKCFAMILVFSVFSILLYKRRKTESSGNAFAYKFLYYICAFIISYCASYALGMIFANGNCLNLDFFIFALIGALICSVVYGAITFRGFKTVKKSLIIGFVSFAVCVASIFAIKLDLTGFNKRIPSKDEIKSVTVEYLSDEIEFTNPDFPISFHKKLVDQKDTLLQTNDNYDGFSHSIGFTYKLKNGSTVRRLYSVYVDKTKDELSKLLKSEERFESISKTLKRTKPATVSFYSSAENGEYIINECFLTLDETQKLLEIYKSEAQKEKQQVLSFGNYCSYNIYWSSGSRYYSIGDLYFDKNYTECAKYIETLNLKERANKYEEVAEAYD